MIILRMYCMYMENGSTHLGFQKQKVNSHARLVNTSL